MRLLTVGLSAFLLTGCAWMGGGQSSHHGHQGHHAQGHYGHNQIHQAPQMPSQWRFDGAIGAQEFTGGNVLQNRQNGLQTTTKQNYKDIYETGLAANAGLSYDVAPRTTLVMEGFYNKANSKDELVNFGTDAAGLAESGRFSDYESYGAQVGFREYMSNDGPGLRPYIGAMAGMSYVNDLDIAVAGATPSTRRIYSGEWVPTASGLVGIEMPVSYAGSLALESGIRYEGRRDAEYMEQFGKTGGNYSVPLKLRGRYRF